MSIPTKQELINQIKTGKYSESDLKLLESKLTSEEIGKQIGRTTRSVACMRVKIKREKENQKNIIKMTAEESIAFIKKITSEPTPRTMNNHSNLYSLNM